MGKLEGVHDRSVHIRQIAKGAGLSLAGMVGERGLRLVVGVALARGLGPAGMGLFALARQTFEILSAVCAFGLPTGIVRYVSIHDSQGERGRVRGVLLTGTLVAGALGVLGTVALALMAPYLATRLFQKPELTAALRVVAIGVPLWSVCTALLWAGKARRTVAPQVAGLLTQALAFLLLYLVAWRLGWGVVGACAAFVGATLVALVLAVALSEAIFADAFRDEAQTRWQPRQLLDFSLPVMVMSVTQLGLSHVNVLLIGFWRPSEDVGIYAAAAALATLGVFVMLAVGQILEPVMAELHSRGDLGGLSAVFQTAAKWGIAGGTPVCLFLILQGRGTLGVFGSEFQAGAACLAVLCLGQMVNGLTGHAGPALVMCGRQWPNLAVTAAGAALNITLCFLLVPRYGIVGGAVASAAALAIVKVTRLVALVRLVGVRPYRMATFRPAATAVVCALPLLLWRTDQWAWALVCFAAYVAAVAALNVVLGLEPDDRMVLDRLLRRDQREGPPGDMERK